MKQLKRDAKAKKKFDEMAMLIDWDNRRKREKEERRQEKRKKEILRKAEEKKEREREREKNRNRQKAILVEKKLMNQVYSKVPLTPNVKTTERFDAMMERFKTSQMKKREERKSYVANVQTEGETQLPKDEIYSRFKTYKMKKREERKNEKRKNKTEGETQLPKDEIYSRVRIQQYHEYTKNKKSELQFSLLNQNFIPLIPYIVEPHALPKTDIPIPRCLTVTKVNSPLSDSLLLSYKTIYSKFPLPLVSPGQQQHLNLKFPVGRCIEVSKLPSTNLISNPVGMTSVKKEDIKITSPFPISSRRTVCRILPAQPTSTFVPIFSQEAILENCFEEEITIKDEPLQEIMSGEEKQKGEEVEIKIKIETEEN